MDPKVSIVIPAYNSGPLLRDTLAGIRSQTIDDFEIIVVDDLAFTILAVVDP